MWRTDYFRGCCTFEVFVSGFINAVHLHKVPFILIDKAQARRNWRSGMTGVEALLTQRNALIKAGEYTVLTPNW